MKTMLLTLALAIPLFAWSQPTHLRSSTGQADKFAAFSAQKKSISLRTGIVMKYVETGNPLGTPVILLHGYTDSGRSFQLTMEALEKENAQLRLIAPDLRGHGESSMPDSVQCGANPGSCFEPADFAADIIAFMDQLGIPKAHIVGHSMGSVVAQELVLKYPGYVNNLALIATSVNGKEAAAINSFLLGELIEKTWRPILEKRPGFRWPADAWSLSPNDLGPEVTTYLKDNWVVELTADSALLQAIYRETAQTKLGTWIGAITALGQLDNREALKNVKKPTLIIWATQDNVSPEYPDQEWVKEAFQSAAQKNGTRVVYKKYGKVPLPESGMQESDLGHNLQWGAPKEVAADIASFIKTGVPKNGLTYANPLNIKQVLTDEAGNNITVFGHIAGLKK